MGKMTSIQRWVLIALAGMLLLVGVIAVLDSSKTTPAQSQQTMF